MGRVFTIRFYTKMPLLKQPLLSITVITFFFVFNKSMAILKKYTKNNDFSIVGYLPFHLSSQFYLLYINLNLIRNSCLWNDPFIRF